MHLQRVDCCRMRKWEQEGEKTLLHFLTLAGSKMTRNSRQRAVIIFSLYLILSLFRVLSLWHFSFFPLKFSSDCPCCQTFDELFFSSHVSTTTSAARVLTQGNALTSAGSYCVRQPVILSVINAVVTKRDVLKVFISFLHTLDLCLSPVLSGPTFRAPLLRGAARCPHDKLVP